MKRIVRWILMGLFFSGRAILCSLFCYLGTVLGLVWPGARHLREFALGCMGMRAVDSGALGRARRLATELLGRAQEYREAEGWEWEAANAIHKSHIILGRVALREGNTDQARFNLLQAGRTPGSPQLNSFGPNMMLAKELLEAGERETVLQYLALCGAFWEMDNGKLAWWVAKVRRGEMPNFRMNLWI